MLNGDVSNLLILTITYKLILPSGIAAITELRILTGMYGLMVMVIILHNDTLSYPCTDWSRQVAVVTIHNNNKRNSPSLSVKV